MAPETSDAVDQIARLGEIGFPEFTHKLITDTFDAVVSSMIRQQEAYADLLEAVSMSVDQFEAENVSDPEVDAWLAATFPSPDSRGSVIGTVASPGELSEGDALRLEGKLGSTATAMDVTLPGDGSLDGEEVELIRTVVRRTIARPRLNAMREMVSQGVVRLVVDDGTIETDLKFETEASELQNQVETDTVTKSHGFGGFGNYTGGLFNIGLNGGYRKINVNTNTETTRGQSEASAEVQGHVKLNVRGDYLPLRPAVTEEAGDELVITE